MRPDLTHKKGSIDGTHNKLYELKVATSMSISGGGSGRLGGKVAFGNTGDEQYNIILGTEESEGRPAVKGVYDDALRGGHEVHPIVLEVLGGFHPDAVRLIDTLARKHGHNVGADELAAPWHARSFRSMHTQRISVALQLAAAEEILDTILVQRRQRRRPPAR